MTAAERQRYIDTVASMVKERVKKYGFGVTSAIVGQFCKESAFGTSELAMNANNHAGIKKKMKADGTPRVPIALSGYNKVSAEVVNGKVIQKSAIFEFFGSLDDCVEGYFQFLSSSSAYNNLRGLTMAQTYAEVISKDNYASDPDYGRSIYEDYVLKYNLEKYDEVKRMKRVMLDAGHDGKRNQSPVYHSYYESDFTWRWQSYLKKYLEKKGILVETTRKTQGEVKDVVPRGTMARGCDLFISGHSNACGTESVNRAVGIYMCNDARTTADERSRDLAQKLASCVASVMGVTYQTYSKIAGYDRNKNGVLTDDEYYGVLHGCQSVGVPGIILEHSFHTNKAAAMWLSNDDNIDKMCKAEADVIADFLGVEEADAIEDVPIVEPVTTVDYTVKKGDTLSAIAARFGKTTDELMILNPSIKDKNRIYVGQKITIVQTQKVYKVVSGDSLVKIGKKLGISWTKIADKNNIKIPWIIHPGDILILP